MPRTGQPNQYSLDFTQGGFAHVNGHGFIFHDPSVGGSPGDATLEWFMKVPAPTGHSAMFWTNGGPADANRFNLFWNASFTGAPDSDRFVDGGFRDPTGAAHNVGGPGYNSGTPVSLDEWHHFAIVRRDLGDGTVAWDWYIDGVLSAGHNAITTDDMPLALDWLIAGRQGGHGVNALFDEIRLTDRALAPGEFLNAVPEPSTTALVGLGLVVLAAVGRRRSRIAS